MEVTFQVGLADKTQDLIQKKKDGDNLFVDNLKRNPKKKNENNDEFGHYDTKNNNKKGRKNKKDEVPQMTQKEKDELDLVLMDPSKKEKVVDDNELTKRKKKKKVTKKDIRPDIDVTKDERFGETLVNDPDFARDPSNKYFQKDASANKYIIREKIKRRDEEGNNTVTKTEQHNPNDVKSMIAKIKRNQAQLTK